MSRLKNKMIIIGIVVGIIFELLLAAGGFYLLGIIIKVVKMIPYL